MNKLISRIALLAATIALAGCGSAADHSASSHLPACSGGAPRIQETTNGPWVCDNDGPINPSAATQPVSTQPTISGNCVVGYETYSPNAASNYGNFTPGSDQNVAPAVDVYGNSWPPITAYQLTLTDTSSVSTNLNQFVVVFYDSNDNAVGSGDQEQITGTIVPNQSLTWTESSQQSSEWPDGDSNNSDGSDNNIPSNAASCQLLQWG